MSATLVSSNTTIKINSNVHLTGNPFSGTFVYTVASNEYIEVYTSLSGALLQVYDGSTFWNLPISNMYTSASPVKIGPGMQIFAQGQYTINGISYKNTP